MEPVPCELRTFSGTTPLWRAIQRHPLVGNIKADARGIVIDPAQYRRHTCRSELLQMTTVPTTRIDIFAFHGSRVYRVDDSVCWQAVSILDCGEENPPANSRGHEWSRTDQETAPSWCPDSCSVPWLRQSVSPRNRGASTRALLFVGPPCSRRISRAAGTRIVPCRPSAPECQRPRLAAETT